MVNGVFSTALKTGFGKLTSFCSNLVPQSLLPHTQNNPNLTLDAAMESEEESDPPIPVATLRHWFIKPKYDNSFSPLLIGYNVVVPEDAPEQDQWTTSLIKDRVDGRPNFVQTHSGSIYKLQGPIDRLMMEEMGYSSTVINVFTNGFPSTWEAFLEEDLQDRKRLLKERKTKPAEKTRVILPPEISVVPNSMPESNENTRKKPQKKGNLGGTRKKKSERTKLLETAHEVDLGEKEVPETGGRYQLRNRNMNATYEEDFIGIPKQTAAKIRGRNGTIVADRSHLPQKASNETFDITPLPVASKIPRINNQETFIKQPVPIPPSETATGLRRSARNRPVTSVGERATNSTFLIPEDLPVASRAARRRKQKQASEDVDVEFQTILPSKKAAMKPAKANADVEASRSRSRSKKEKKKQPNEQPEVLTKTKQPSKKNRKKSDAGSYIIPVKPLPGHLDDSIETEIEEVLEAERKQKKVSKKNQKQVVKSNSNTFVVPPTPTQKNQRQVKKKKKTELDVVLEDNVLFSKRRGEPAVIPEINQSRVTRSQLQMTINEAVFLDDRASMVIPDRSRGLFSIAEEEDDDEEERVVEKKTKKREEKTVVEKQKEKGQKKRSPIGKKKNIKSKISAPQQIEKKKNGGKKEKKAPIEQLLSGVSSKAALVAQSSVTLRSGTAKKRPVTSVGERRSTFLASLPVERPSRKNKVEEKDEEQNSQLVPSKPKRVFAKKTVAVPKKQPQVKEVDTTVAPRKSTRKRQLSPEPETLSQQRSSVEDEPAASQFVAPKPPNKKRRATGKVEVPKASSEVPVSSSSVSTHFESKRSPAKAPAAKPSKKSVVLPPATSEASPRRQSAKKTAKKASSKKKPSSKKKRTVRTVNWYREQLAQQLPTSSQSNSTFSFFSRSSSQHLTHMTLAKAEWDFTGMEDFTPTKFTDTTRTFRLSAGRPVLPEKSTYEPKNVQKAADKINFHAFLEAEKEQEKMMKRVERSRVGSSRPASVAHSVPMFPAELRALEEEIF